MAFDLVALRAEIADAWNKAEHAIKLAEQANGQVVDPAIYELRYAGRKLIEADQFEIAGDAEKCAELLRDAKMDCWRARHDAIDAATSKVILDLQIAVEKLGAERVVTCFPAWSETYAHLCDVREKIAFSRGARNDRAKIYETIEAADLPKIIKLYNEFKAMEPVLVKQARRGRWKAAGGWLFGAAIGIGGIVVPWIM